MSFKGIVNKYLNSDYSSKNNEAYKLFHETAPVNGVYLGRVVSTEDVLKSGLITVSISKLGKDDSTTETEFYCFWSSPFAGTTDISGVGPEVENYDQTQQSYGMWMIPPDVGNIVLVTFVDGNLKMPFIVGCLFDNQYHYMTPGMASGKSYSDPSMKAPVAEKNRTEARTTHDDAARPIHIAMAETVNAQGLINDEIRGVGSSSSRRESPSEVFGILTPGPKAVDFDRTRNREAGHQFIMDDNRESRLIRLRTAGGSQLLLDDTTKSVYVINKPGNAWFEMTATGEFNFYAGSSINFRTRGNFNIRADKNLNLEAGNDVNIRASGAYDDPILNAANKLIPGLPPGLGGGGGDIRLDAGANFVSLARGNQTITSGGGTIDMTSAGATRIRCGVQGDDPTLGFLVKAVGGIAMDCEGPLELSTTALGNIFTGGILNLFGSITHINNPAGAGIGAAAAAKSKARALLMTSATPLGTNDFEDNSTDPPEFDKEAARKGQTGFPTGGLREKGDSIASIVTTLVTNEPFIGHAQFDPTDVAATNPDEIGYLDPTLPPDGTDLSGKPADVSTPEGYLAGIGYTNKDGDTVSAGGAIGSAVSEATNQLSNLGGQFNDLTGQYQQISGVFNNFQTLANLNLTSIEGLTAAIGAIQSILPWIPFPTTTPLQQKIVGYSQKLNEQMAQLQQFGLDQLGIQLDLDIESMKIMQDKISAAINAAGGDLGQLNSLLAQAGIEKLDIPGENIFKDQFGNLLVDFGSGDGLGPVGASLGLVSDINTSFNNVKGYFNEGVALSENQTVAISNFVHQIGEENFLNSNVFEAINTGKLNRVPHLMQGWTLGSSQTGGALTELPYLVERRQWEAEIFQTPDGVEPPDFALMATEGELTFAKAASMYKAKRESYLLSLYNTAETQGLA